MQTINLEMILRNILLAYVRTGYNKKDYHLQDQLKDLKIELEMQVWANEPFTCFLYQIYRDNCHKRIPSYESRVGWHTYTLLVIFLRMHLQGDNPPLSQHLRMRKILTLNKKIISQIRVALWLGREFCEKLTGEYDQQSFDLMNKFIKTDFNKKSYVQKYKLPANLEKFTGIEIDYVSPILLCA